MSEAVTTEEIEAVRSALYSYPHMPDALAQCGIAADRAAQFERIFAANAVANAKARQGAPKRNYKPKRCGR